MESSIEPTTKYVSGDLVVDLSDVDRVTRLLEGLQPRITITGRDDDGQLRLALLNLDGVQAHAEGDAEPLDVLLRRIRAELPGVTIGKNRDINGVIGFPQSKSLAVDWPHPATAQQFPGITEPTIPGGVRVGVLDTGLFPHPALEGHYAALDDDDLYRPADGERAEGVPGHATVVAGLIAARAPEAFLVPRRLLSDRGMATAWATAKAMAALVRANVPVVNLSLGCRTADNCEPLTMQRAVEVLGEVATIVAAAGNHWDTDYRHLRTWPAALEGVVSVGAAVETEFAPGTEPTPADYSPRFDWVRYIAPGDGVVSTFLNGALVETADGWRPFEGYARWSGTSFAAAQVSGAIAHEMAVASCGAEEALRRLVDSDNGVVRRYTGRPGLPCEGRPDGGASGPAREGG
jgi:hypothetical protein